MKPMKTDQSWRKSVTFQMAVTARMTSRMIRILGTKKNRLDRIRMRMRTAKKATTNRTGDLRGENLSLSIARQEYYRVGGIKSNTGSPVAGLEKKDLRPSHTPM